MPSVTARERRHGIVGGLLGIVGALVVLLACVLPYSSFASDSGKVFYSFFNPGFEGGLWFAAEPVGVTVMGIVAALAIVISRRPVVQIAGAALLVGIGAQTLLLFIGYLGSRLTVEIGVAVGLAGALSLAIGGFIAAIRVVRAEGKP